MFCQNKEKHLTNVLNPTSTPFKAAGPLTSPAFAGGERGHHGRLVRPREGRRGHAEGARERPCPCLRVYLNEAR